jgi:hypothetical protein
MIASQDRDSTGDDVRCGIDRKLARQHQRLRVDRRGDDIRHIVIDTKKGAVIELDVDLEKLAHRLGVLEPWERPASASTLGVLI